MTTPGGFEYAVPVTTDAPAPTPRQSGILARHLSPQHATAAAGRDGRLVVGVELRARDLVDAVDQAVRVAVGADEIDADASVVAVNIATAEAATRRHDHADGGPAGAGTGQATTSFDP